MKMIYSIVLLSILILFPSQVISLESGSLETDDILSILEEATVSAGDIKNGTLRGYFYDQIAPVFVELGHLEKAIAIANRKDNVVRDSTLQEICRQLVKSDRIKEAFDTAKKVITSHYIGSVFQELAPNLTEEDQKSQALSLLQNALIETFKKKGYFKSPLGVSPMRKIAEVQHLLGHTETSLHTVQQLLDFAKSSPEFRNKKDQYFRVLAQIQGKIGAIPLALSTLQKIQDVKEKQKALRGIARDQVWAGHIPQAKELIRKLQNPYDRDRVWQSISKFYADSDDSKNALEKTSLGIDKPSTIKSFAIMFTRSSDSAGLLKLLHNAFHEKVV